MASEMPGEGQLTKPDPFRMQYFQSYRFIFENPGWFMTVVWGFLCMLSTQLIPLVGQMVFAGYECEVLETLHRTGGARYPAFDINRFADYLVRSIPPLLVNLLISLPFAILFGVAYVGGIVATLVAAESNASENVSLLAVTLIGVSTVFLLLTLMFLWMFVITPFSLRACLSQDFAGSLNFRWALDVYRKTWLETTLAIQFFLVTMFIFSIFGFLALCIGSFAAFVIVCLSETHLYYQLYQVFLARGGEAIPLRPVRAPPVARLPPA
jgi:hypothetical protein